MRNWMISLALLGACAEHGWDVVPVPDDAGQPAADAGAALGRDGWLLVAELGEGQEALHAYSLPELRHTGQLDGVRVGNHVGAIALADGRVIVTDEAHGEVLAVAIDEQGRPTVANRASADLGEEGAAWGCGDKDLRYLAIASGHEGTAQTANILDTASFALTKFSITINEVAGSHEELHPAIAGDPLHLFAGVGGEVRAYLLADVLRGSASALASVAIRTGSHGPLVSHTTGEFYIATAEGGGFDGVELAPPFARAQLIPWDVDGLSSGRNARPRLGDDGRHILGAIAHTQPTGAERWAERAVDLHIADLETKRARRSPLGSGQIAKFQLARGLALFAEIAAGGDSAILVDADASSQTFGQIVARIPLAPLQAGPVAGQPTMGKEARGSAITPDGKWGFVSHGGDGLISVIDTAQRKLAGSIHAPTPLRGGGFLFAVQRGVRSADTCMR
jgi:hypothetical protein